MMATAKRPAALSRDVQSWSYSDRGDVYEYIDDLERERERLAQVAEDRIAALDRCTERAVFLERKLDTLTANPSTETLKDPCHQCGSTNIWHGYDATNQIEYDVCNDCGRRVNALPGEPKASEDTDPSGRATGEVLGEPQTITEADAAAGLEKMFEEPKGDRFPKCPLLLGNGMCDINEGLDSCHDLLEANRCPRQNPQKPPEEPRERVPRECKMSMSALELKCPYFTRNGLCSYDGPVGSCHCNELPPEEPREGE